MYSINFNRMCSKYIICIDVRYGKDSVETSEEEQNREHFPSDGLHTREFCCAFTGLFFNWAGKGRGGLCHSGWWSIQQVWNFAMSSRTKKSWWLHWASKRSKLKFFCKVLRNLEVHLLTANRLIGCVSDHSTITISHLSCLWSWTGLEEKVTDLQTRGKGTCFSSFHLHWCVSDPDLYPMDAFHR